MKPMRQLAAIVDELLLAECRQLQVVRALLLAPSVRFSREIAGLVHVNKQRSAPLRGALHCAVTFLSSKPNSWTHNAQSSSWMPEDRACQKSTQGRSSSLLCCS